MKILYLTPGCFDKGGISRYNRYQISALRELYGDKNVRVLSLLQPNVDDFEEPFVVHWHGTGIGAVSKMRYTLQALFQAITWNPDLVLIAHVNFAGIGKLVSAFRRNTTLLNTYGLEVWSGLKRLPHWGLKKVDHVISDCHYTARYLENEGFRPKGSVHVIWDCVDLDRFFSKPADVTALSSYGVPDPNQFKLVISLGRISKAAAHKGYDRLIQAFALIHEKFPKARLVFAGKGDWIDHLKNLANGAGISQKITFTGMVQEQHLVEIYRAAYIFSLASDRGKGRGEGIPLTPLEAMSCGAPIIVGNYDGSQEAIFDDRNGYVIDSLDIQSHAEKLSILLSDEKLRNEKGNQAIEISRQFFSYVEFKEKHKKLLDVISPKSLQNADI